MEVKQQQLPVSKMREASLSPDLNDVQVGLLPEVKNRSIDHNNTTDSSVQNYEGGVINQLMGPGRFTYDKDALAQFRKIDYVRGLNGHCDFQSVNSLRNSIKMAINMDGKMERFKAEPRSIYSNKGGHFAETTYNIGTFEKKDFHRANEPKKEDLPNGRPLFTMELRRNKNPRHVYDIKRNPDIEPVNVKKPCTFGHSYEHYRRTCDGEKGIKVFDYAADKSNADQIYPIVEQSKKRWPAYSQGKARQFTLWEKEEKKSLVTPGPHTYDQGDEAIKPQRFKGVGLGRDIKCTLRDIELTPGAGDYNTVQTGNDGNSFLKKTHNYFLEHGGVMKPFLKKQPKEALMEKAFVFNRGASAKSRTGSALSRKSGGLGGYGQKSTRTKDSSIIQQNILAVKNHNTYLLGSSNAGDATQYTKADLSDTMGHGPGAKFGYDSVSDSNLGNSNYGKGRKQFAESQDISGFDMKKGRKAKRLPRINDGVSRATPNQRMQHSTDFTKGGKRRVAHHEGGYETENVVSPDHGRNDMFKFGSTYDSGFENSNDIAFRDDGPGSVGQQKKKRKYHYMTVKAANEKSRSVSSNLGRLDHTCFI